MRDRGLDLTAQLLDRLLGSYTIKIIGVWRSWLARAVWDREVEGSSPFTPTIETTSLSRGYFLFRDVLIYLSVEK